MNVYDSGRMADVLAPLGYSATEHPENADMVIVNTCHIREKASEKTFSELGRLRALKQRKEAAGGRMILAVAGCVAQAEGEEISRRAPYVDMIFGPQSYHHLPEMVAQATRAVDRTGVLDTEFPIEPKFDFLPQPGRPQGYSAFLTVQEGCDKFCTFCVVPYTRGAEYSRPAVDVLREARQLVANGVREITLLGQNVNAYHGTGQNGNAWSLARLCLGLAEIDGLQRLRYTTSHPRDMDADLIAAHRDCPILMPYLHLPVQSGSNSMLAAMNRRYSVGDYVAVVERLRMARPDIALSGDFIVGFPGESDADFEATLTLVRQVAYAQAYSFKYSSRPGTPASLLARQVPDDVKTARLAVLQMLLNEQQLAFNKATIGRTMPVLLDRPGRRDGQLVGRSPYMQAVHLDAAGELLGEIVDVRIETGLANSLSGRIVATETRQTAAATAV